jgi:glycerol-1-phosphate dehydrogenase [NAD(P)+]
MHADARGGPVASHGSRVGVASVVAVAVWRRVRSCLADGGVRVRPLDEEVLEARVRVAFGALDEDGVTAQECWSAYRRKLDWMREHQEAIQRLCDTWPSREPVVADLMQGSDVLAATLRRAGAPVRFADLVPAPDPGTVRWAVQNCHLMRDRFSVVDLAELIGMWTADDVEAVLMETQEESWA